MISAAATRTCPSLCSDSILPSDESVSQKVSSTRPLIVRTFALRTLTRRLASAFVKANRNPTVSIDRIVSSVCRG